MTVDTFTHSQKKLNLTFTENKLIVKRKDKTRTYLYDDLGYQLPPFRTRDGWINYYSVKSEDHTWTDPDTGEILFSADSLDIVHKDGQVKATINPSSEDYYFKDFKQLCEKICSRIQCWPNDNVVTNTFYFNRLSKFILISNFTFFLLSLILFILLGINQNQIGSDIRVWLILMGFTTILLGCLALYTSKSRKYFPMLISNVGISIIKENNFIPFSDILIDWRGNVSMRIITPNRKISLNTSWIKNLDQFLNVLHGHADHYRKKNWPPKELDNKIFHYRKANTRLLILELIIYLVTVLFLLILLLPVSCDIDDFFCFLKLFMISFSLISILFFPFILYSYKGFRHRGIFPIVFNSEGINFTNSDNTIPWNDIETEEGIFNLVFLFGEKKISVFRGSMPDEFLVKYFLHSFLVTYNEKYAASNLS